MSEKRHKINKFENYQNLIVRNSPAFTWTAMFLFLIKTAISTQSSSAHVEERDYARIPKPVITGVENEPLIYGFWRNVHDQYTNPLARPLLTALQVMTTSSVFHLRECIESSSPPPPADFRYLIAYEINAQGWKERLGLEGVEGWGGAFSKLLLPRRGGGVQFSFVVNFFFFGGGILIHHTFLTPPPLWDVINDQSLKRLINRKLVSEEVSNLIISQIIRQERIQHSPLQYSVFFSFEDFIKMHGSPRN